MASICVIVPTYNYGAFIGEALASIQAQTHPPQQILVIDDGSSDGTAEIVAGMQIPNLQYVHQANAGVSAARNHALALTNADYVTFLDADDRWRPTMLQQQLQLLQEVPEAVFSFTNFVRFEHDTGAFLSDQFAYYPELERLPTLLLSCDHGHLIQTDAFNALIGFGEIPAYTQVMMFNTRRIQGLRFDESLRVCEDTEFVLRAALRGQAVYTDLALAEIRRHGKNATTTYSMMALDKLNALQRLEHSIHTPQHMRAYKDRMVKAHLDAAIACTRHSQRLRGMRLYMQALGVPGSSMRKVKGAMRLMQSSLTHSP